MTLPENVLAGLAINPGPRETVLPSVDELRAMGAKWVRYLLRDEFQNTATGNNLELDLLLDRYRDLDTRVLVLVNPETLGEVPPPATSSDWGDANAGYIGRVSDLAQKIAAFYNGRIAALEVFNEPDSQQILPEQYGALLAATYPKIKAVSDVPVISAGICCGKNHPYLQAVMNIARDQCDAVGWHPYGLRVENYPTSDWGLGDLRDSITRARAIAGKPLWITEIGAELAYQWNQSPEQAVAEYLTRAFNLMRELGKDTVAHAFWFTWRMLEEGWGIVDTTGAHRAAWYALQQQTHPTPTISQVRFTPSTVVGGDSLNVSITVNNLSDDTLATQGPNPGFEYTERDTFFTRGYPDVPGAFRVAVDFDGRTGVDHPYRWGFSTPLAPGETRTITGAIRLTTPQTKTFWAGLVQERTAWRQDRQGAQAITVTPGFEITDVAFTPTALLVGELLNVSVTVKNTSNTMLPTQGPDPGFEYDEGDSFISRGFSDTPGNFRIGIDFENRAGIDHPYRWGLGAPLAPGETRTITGAIRLKQTQSQNYWAGLVQERVAWWQAKRGAQKITATLPAGKPRIVSVAFSPTQLNVGDLLNVSVTVRNESNAPALTQEPTPGLVYDEGDTFYTRGFPDTSGAFRVAVDFDGRTGVDHPYRWGFGTPLAPGETRTVVGAIRLNTAQSKNYWVGLVQEQIEWAQDQAGTQRIIVDPVPMDAPQIVGVEFSPTTVAANELVNVSITLKNTAPQTIATQGPDPGFVYTEGDTFYTRGFPDIYSAFRVAVDFDGRIGVDHPYRWGLGAPLAPGETRTITGAIRLTNARVARYWAGLVQERVAWHRDQVGTQMLTVKSGEPPRVIHVHDTRATTWSGQPKYWTFVNQDVVNEMVERGVMTLTNRATVADAWRALLPSYQSGQGIALKVNFANGGNGNLDAVVETLNAIVRGLQMIGVQANDVWVFDATHVIPERYVNGCAFTGIRFFDTGGHERASFDSTAPDAKIVFAPPAEVMPLPTIKLTDVLVNATYVINLPIFKGHKSGAGITLGFKNHLGSTNLPSGFHPYIFPAGARFRTDYNPLVDLYRMSSIRAKTVLTIADGLFTGDDWNSPAKLMRTFGNQTPNSLFFATDPVALDSVLCDLLDAEWGALPNADNYLRLASELGLGVFERGDPWGAGYTRIDYRKM
ncbi:MAG: DUF362 domain-containing protein [Chloroflexi bacterium]|nr:DUF362 domain-containing protein [Chloroflexota bacterium]